MSGNNPFSVFDISQKANEGKRYRQEKEEKK